MATNMARNRGGQLVGERKKRIDKREWRGGRNLKWILIVRGEKSWRG